jgi:hypothetical protein
MKTDINTLKQALAGFLDGEFIPKYRQTHSAAAAYGVSVVAALAIDNLSVTAGKLIDNPLVSYLGVIDGNRNLDVDKIVGIMRQKMPNEGLRVAVPMVGTLVFSREDVDALEGYIKLQCGNMDIITE